MLLMCLEVLREGFFCLSLRDWERVCRKLLSLVFLNFQLLAKMLNFIFNKVTWKLSYLRWLNFVQENWLRGHTSCLHWKWLICFRISCQTFPQKMWVLRFQDLNFLWLIGHSWSPKIKFCMSGKQCEPLHFCWKVESPTKFSKKRGVGGKLDMNTIFRWRLLRKIGVRFFRMWVGVQF